MPDIKERLRQYKGKKTVLYGLGTETERALKQLEDYFDVIGLLDGFQVFGKLYGKPVISLEKVEKEAAELIIVVARPGSCRVIAKRINSFCRENQIALYDIRGKDLLVQRKTSYDLRDIHGGTIDELMKKINAADIVSFDLFDTLVTRKVLSYIDLFEILDYQLKEKEIVIPDFTARRLASEKELAKYGAPSLREIYEYLLKYLPDKVNVSAEALADMEWRADYKTVILRASVCNIFREVLKHKKSVYIVTDTYYSRKQIEQILESCNINGCAGVYVSSEYHTGKTQELFDIFKREQGEKRYLHIGDNETADIEYPARRHMDTFRIFSGMDFLEELGYLGMEEYIENLPDRVRAGLFVSRIFNDPFQFETDKGKIKIEHSRDIGYLICAPVICDFLLWLCRRIKEKRIKTVFFSARDGYLLKKLYEMIEDQESIYFLTSRIAAIRAGVEDESDIAYVESMKFPGTLDENLSVRFGIQADGLIKYPDAILENAKALRKNYKKYIDSLKLPEGDIVFFDFVAKGTTQMYVQKLMNRRIKGLYFLQLEPEFMEDKHLDIEPFYSKETIEGSAIFDDYYILETLLTAPHPQVLQFDESGKPVYAKETRSEQDIQCVCDMQEGVAEYFEDYRSLITESVHTENKKLDEVMLRFIHTFEIADEAFGRLFIEDPFFNRMTPVTDLY